MRLRALCFCKTSATTTISPGALHMTKSPINSRTFLSANPEASAANLKIQDPDKFTAPEFRRTLRGWILGIGLSMAQTATALAHLGSLSKAYVQSVPIVRLSLRRLGARGLALLGKLTHSLTHPRIQVRVTSYNWLTLVTVHSAKGKRQLLSKTK